MGYYDENHENDQDSKENGHQSRETHARGGWFLSGFIGAIVGMVCLLIFAPILSDLGVFPYQVSTGAQNTNNVGNTTFNRQMNVNVTTSVTEAVDKVSPAVIAVINLQKANFFDNKYTESGIGSGIIYKKDNQYSYIVTNNHVVSGAEKLKCG